MPSLAPADVLVTLLSPVLVFLCVVLAWRGMSLMRHPRRQDLFLLPWALATAVVWHPGTLKGLLRTGSDGASFSPPPAVLGGLIALTAVAALVPVVASVTKTRALREAYRRDATLAPPVLDITASVLLGLVALALAPPLLDACQRLLLPELPARWAADSVPSLERLVTFARPGIAGSPADHAAALFVRTLALAALLGWLLDVRRRRRALGAVRAGGIVAGLAMLHAIAALAFG